MSEVKNNENSYLIESLESRISFLANKLTAAQAEIEKLRQDVDDWKSINENLQRKIAKLKQENKQLFDAAENKGTQALRYLREKHKLQSVLDVKSPVKNDRHRLKNKVKPKQ